MFFLCAAMLTQTPAAYADGVRRVLQSERGKLFAAYAGGEAVLSAVGESDIFYREIRIALFANGEEKGEIVPKTDSGYNPHIQLVSFDGETEQIFYGADSGGSGGFGFFYVYRTEGEEIREIFSSETFEVPYEASYVDGYAVEVRNVRTGSTSRIDLSDRGAEYLSQIYRADGALIEPRSCYVTGVSDAIPFYNYATGRYGMELYARILGLYGADTVGYIIMRLYEEGGFVSFFDLTAVYAG